MRLAVLGGVRAWHDGRETDLGARRPRLLAAALLARAGQPVLVPELVELLWGDEPPANAVNMVQRHAGTVRRAIEPGLPSRAEGSRLVRVPGGYRLVLDASEADLPAFRERVAVAEAGLRSGRRGAAVTAFRQALELWQGPFADGLGVDHHPLVVAVNRERSAAARAAADAALGVPQAASLLPAVHAAAEAEPFDEALQARLLLLLAAAGRPGEAVERYHRLRARLAADLGTVPGPELTAAVESVLREPPVPLRGPAPAPIATAPAHLPPGPGLFTGRETEKRSLHRLLDETTRSGTSCAVLAIDGIPGVGKSALAVHWAHEVAPRFPDGQLHLRLHGFADRDPLTPGEAVVRLLGALGVRRSEVPANPDARAALFRTLTAGRRLLILLDDARDAAQVRPLIPAAPGSLVLVTSRGRLTALAAADGARLRTLRVPPPGEAREQLLSRLGAEPPRDTRENAALDAILARSGRLPLALAIVGARMSAYRPVRLAEVAAALERSTGLDAFTGDDDATDLRSVFARSYRHLTPPAAALFRRLATTGPPAPALDPVSVALDPVAARRGEVPGAQLAELVAAGLLTRTGPWRYEWHGLLRDYARELTTTRSSSCPEPAPC